jgi:hypothetical protein
MYRAINPDGGFYDNFLGSEIDVVLSHKFSKEVLLKSGFAYGLPTNVLAEFKNVKADMVNPFSSYVMLIVTPKFLHTNIN